MEGADLIMFEEHDKELKDQKLRLENLEREHQTFKIQMEGIKLDNAKLQTGQASLEHTVSTLSISVKHLDNTVTTDGKETRDLLKTAFKHVLDRDKDQDKSKTKLSFRKLAVKEKIALGVLAAITGSGGILAGIAAIMTIMGGQ